MICKKFISIIAITLILASFLITSPSNSASLIPCTVYGYIYVNGAIADPFQVQKVVLNFSTQEIEADLFENNTYYIVDFSEDKGEMGTFEVTITTGTWLADENITMESGVYNYSLDLHINVSNPPVNSAPNKPSDPTPENNSINIGLNPTLSVHVLDLDGDIMEVSFYNSSYDSLIGVVSDVASNTYASIVWKNLSYNTTYSWYAVANDSELENISDVFTFKTRKKENQAPHVKIMKPEQGALYFRNKKIPLSFLNNPIIIGDITIEVNATDEDSGIEKVEITVKGLIFEKTETLSTEPYQWDWNTSAFGRYTITAKAYDAEGKTSKDSIIIRKFF